MNNQKLLQPLLYLFAFSFMRVIMHAPFVQCKSVAEKVVSDVK